MENKVCRTCLSRTGLNPIFLSSEDCDRYSAAIHMIAGVKVTPNDGLPQDMCTNCITFLNKSLQFREKCRDTETYLLQMKKNLESVTLDGDITNIDLKVMMDIEQVMAKTIHKPKDEYFKVSKVTETNDNVNIEAVELLAHDIDNIIHELKNEDFKVIKGTETTDDVNIGYVELLAHNMDKIMHEPKAEYFKVIKGTETTDNVNINIEDVELLAHDIDNIIHEPRDEDLNVIKGTETTDDIDIEIKTEDLNELGHDDYDNKALKDWLDDNKESNVINNPVFTTNEEVEGNIDIENVGSEVIVPRARYRKVMCHVCNMYVRCFRQHIAKQHPEVAGLSLKSEVKKCILCHVYVPVTKMGRHRIMMHKDIITFRCGGSLEGGQKPSLKVAEVAIDDNHETTPRPRQDMRKKSLSTKDNEK